MKKMIHSLLIMSILIPSFLLTGCASFMVSQEALERSERALEQAELANQRIDKLVETSQGK